jgi:hypothetical protein
MGEISKSSHTYKVFGLLTVEDRGVCKDQKPTNLTEKHIRDHVQAQIKQIIEKHEFDKLNRDARRRLVEREFDRIKEQFDQLCRQPALILGGNFRLSKSTKIILKEMEKRAEPKRKEDLISKIEQTKKKLCKGTLRVKPTAKMNGSASVFVSSGCGSDVTRNVVTFLEAKDVEELTRLVDWLDENLEVIR